MSEVVMVIATVIMAIFTGLSWYVSWQVKKDGAKRDVQTHELFIKLTAGILASGRAAGEPPIAAKLFQEHEKALRNEIEKTEKL